MQKPGVEACTLYPFGGAHEASKLRFCGPAALRLAEVGVQPAYAQRRRGGVKRQKLAKLRGEEAAAAHAGVELYVRLGRESEPFRRAYEPAGVLLRADGEYHAKLQQLFGFPDIRDRLEE